MNLSEFKDAAEAAAAVATTLAVIVGGVWVYWRFIFQREREPRAEFDVSAEFVGFQDNKWLIELSARLANKGQVRHDVKEATVEVRYLRANDAVVESANPRLFRQIDFPNRVERRVMWWNSYIDPGLEFRNSYVTAIPGDATFILLLCQFHYKKEKEKWPAQRLLKVPSRPVDTAGASHPEHV